MKSQQVYAFNYMGGSTFGGERTVFVKDMDNRYVTGYDLEAQEYRKYLRTKIRNPVELVSTVISTAGLPSRTTNRLRDDFQADGKEVFWLGDNTLVAYEKKPFTVIDIEGRMTVVQSGKPRLYISRLGIQVGFQAPVPLTPANLVQVLKDYV